MLITQLVSPAAPAHLVTAEFESLKATIDVYRTIFNEVVLHETHSRIARISAPYHSVKISKNQPPLYIVYDEPIACKGGISSTTSNILDFGEETAAKLQNAYLKWNHCDNSLDMMLDPIAQKLGDVGAQSDWLLVRPRQQFALCFVDEAWELPIHSVFGITSATGGKYVADFTMEQFGHDGASDWFMPMQDYLDKYTTNGVHRAASANHRDDILNDDDDHRAWVEEVKEFCYALEWEKLEKMDRKKRAAKVQKQANEAFKMFWTMENLSELTLRDGIF